MIEGDEVSLNFAAQSVDGSQLGRESNVQKVSAAHKRALESEIVAEEDERESDEVISQSNKLLRSAKSDEMASVAFDDLSCSSASQTSIRQVEGSFSNKLELSRQSRRNSMSATRRKRLKHRKQDLRNSFASDNNKNVRNKAQMSRSIDEGASSNGGRRRKRFGTTS